MSETPTAVRILPMSSKDEPIFVGLSAHEVQHKYFLGELVRPDRPPGKYRYRTAGLQAQPGTVVLFQYAGGIIASATLNRVVRFEVPDGPYKGALHFDADSIRVFDPVGSDVITQIWPEFKGFGQAKWSLDPKGYRAFEQKLTSVEEP